MWFQKRDKENRWFNEDVEPSSFYGWKCTRKLVKYQTCSLIFFLNSELNQQNGGGLIMQSDHETAYFKCSCI